MKKVTKKPNKKCLPCGKSVRKKVGTAAGLVIDCPAGTADGEWHVRVKRVNGVCTAVYPAV